MRFHTLILIFTCLFYSTSFVFSPVSLYARGEEDQYGNSEEVEFIKGADVSRLDKAENHGGVYKVNGVPKDALHIFKDHWFNYIRLMIWHTPPENYHNLVKVLSMAQRIKALDMNPASLQRCRPTITFSKTAML